MKDASLILVKQALDKEAWVWPAAMILSSLAPWALEKFLPNSPQQPQEQQPVPQSAQRKQRNVLAQGGGQRPQPWRPQQPMNFNTGRQSLAEGLYKNSPWTSYTGVGGEAGDRAVMHGMDIQNWKRQRANANRIVNI